MEHSTIAAIATAPGAGGIAVVRLSGPESYAVAAKVFCPANPAKRVEDAKGYTCLLYTSPSPRDRQKSRMPSSA